jgi:hypothetical protein
LLAQLIAFSVNAFKTFLQVFQGQRVHCADWWNDYRSDSDVLSWHLSWFFGRTCLFLLRVLVR